MAKGRYLVQATQAARYYFRHRNKARGLPLLVAHAVRNRYLSDAIDTLPSATLDSLFPGISDAPVCLSHRLEHRMLPYGEAYVLAAIVHYLQPRTIFEIGTFIGASTLLMAQQSDNASKIYTLDLPSGTDLLLPGLTRDKPETARIGERFLGLANYGDRIVQLFGDSATFDFSPYEGEIDFMFIDGSHSYPYVRNDTERALSVLSPNGTILWDDYSTEFPDVLRALSEFRHDLPIAHIAYTRFAVCRRGTPSR